MNGWGVAAPGAAVALASAVAAGLFLAGWRHELRGGAGSGRRIRLALLAVSLLALLALALRPFSPGVAGPPAALLLTAGAEGGREGEGPPVFTLVPEAAGERIGDLGELARRHPEVRKVDVAGYGLPEWAWLGSGLAVGDFQPPALPAGLRGLRWPRRVALGEEMEVRGEVAVEAPARLVWSGPGGELAARELAPGISSFRFRDRPRAAGRLLYRLSLEARDGREEAILDGVAVAPSPVRMAWLESAPDFESRELRAWYRSTGGELTVRTRISRDRYRVDAVNRPAVAPWPAAGGTAGEVDLLVVDRRSWSELERVQRERVTAAVRETGLGLLLRLGAGESPPRDAPFEAFRVVDVGGSDALEVRVLGDVFASREPLRAAARQLEAGRAVYPLLWDGAGRVLAGRTAYGRGGVGLTLLEATYRWRLAGAAEDHAAVWTALAQALGRPRDGGRIVLPEGPIRAGEPLRVEWRGPAGPLQIAVEGPDGRAEPLAFLQTGAGERAWMATYRPRRPGWHRVASPGGESADFWAQERQALPAMRAARSVAATRARAVVGTRAVEGRGAPPARPQPRPLPRAWAFVLWLLASGGLWLEEGRRGHGRSPARERPGSRSGRRGNALSRDPEEDPR